MCKTILVLEHDINVYDALNCLLKYHDIEIIKTTSFRETIEEIAKRLTTLEMIIIPSVVKGNNVGIQVIEYCDKCDKKVPVIIIDNSKESVIDRFIRKKKPAPYLLRAYQLFKKPVILPKLIKLIDKLIIKPK